MYSLIYCDEWDHDQGEPAGGGRCLGEAASEAEALALAGQWSRYAWWYFGEGEVVVTDPAANYVRAYPAREAGHARAA